MIVVLWRRITEATPALRPLAWLPVLFWAAIPLVTWSYSNNMLENTLSIFTTGACGVARRHHGSSSVAALADRGGLIASDYLARAGRVLHSLLGARVDPA
jgi:hypothetical protein